MEFFESTAESNATTVDSLVQDYHTVMRPLGARVPWRDPGIHDWSRRWVTDRQGDSYAVVAAPLKSDRGLVDAADEDVLKVFVDELRGHISQFYRLHWRTIRNRRSQATVHRAGSGFAPCEVRRREPPRCLMTEASTDERIRRLIALVSIVELRRQTRCGT